ncbi:MAG: hypothetical protein AB1646_02430 [Thermodesulfobacteriota bacterium]
MQEVPSPGNLILRKAIWYEMIITGSAILVRSGSSQGVIEALEAVPEVTIQARSDSGTELIVNLEADDSTALDDLCARLKRSIPAIVDISHVSVHFEDEVERMIGRSKQQREES